MAWRRSSPIHYALFVRHLAREFRTPLILFVALLLIGGGILHFGADVGYFEGVYDVFLMVFMEAPLSRFPSEWYVRVFLFLVPVIGLLILADGLIRFGMLVFSRKRHLQEWWHMVAQSMKGHVVLCGLGRVGYRVAHELLGAGVPFVAIERNPDSALVKELQEMDVPVLIGEARLEATLRKANITAAQAIIAATDDDLANFDAALTAKEINPNLRIVLRLFDDTLANKVAKAFGLPAVSTSKAAASRLVAAALGRKVYLPVELGDSRLHLADVTVGAGSRLVGRTIADASREADVGIAILRRGKTVHHRIDPQMTLQEGDELVVAGDPERIQALE